MKKLKIAAGILLFFVLLIIVFPLLYPLNLYIPSIQKNLSGLLRTQVTIGDISVAYAPMPRFVLERVLIGPERQAEIRRIVVVPEYVSWLGGGRRLKQLLLEGATVKQQFLLQAPLLLQGLQQDKHYLVRQMSFTDAHIAMTHESLGPYQAEVSMDRAGGLQRLLLSQEGKSATLTVEPFEGKYKYGFDAQSWALEGLDGIKFSTLTVNGIGNADSIDFNDIRGVVYGGTLTGTARLFFDGQWRLLGKYKLANLQAEPLTSAFSQSTTLEGRLNAEGSFVASARYLEDLAKKPQTQAQAIIRGGSVNNFDLITAIRYNDSSGNGLRGGKTRFDDLSFTFDMREQRYRFGGINLQSGLLSATGNLALSEKGGWSGGLHVRLKSAANPLSVALGVVGPLDSPLLRPLPARPETTAEHSPQNGVASPDF